MNHTKKSLISSVVSLMLCFSMLLGSTYAWFTDSATSSGNIVQSGELNVKMYWADSLLAADSSEWKDVEVEANKTIFTHDNWEPGYTEVKYIKVENAGNLALKWRLNIEAPGEVTKLAEVIDVYYVNPVSETVTKDTISNQTTAGVLSEVIETHEYTDGVLLPRGEKHAEYANGDAILAIALHMQEGVGNEYQKMSIGDGFSVRLIASQFNYEKDSFGTDYDKDSQWPDNVVLSGQHASAPVPPVTSDGKTSEEVSMQTEDGTISATVPAGVKLEQDVTQLTVVIDNVEESQADVSLGETEASLSIDVHIHGVAADNQVVMAIGVKALLPVGLNLGNYRFYHVENGGTVAMTLRENGAAPIHNSFDYDPTTGDVVLYLKSFSEVATVADTENAWEGKFDYSWYDASKTEFTIANADQLAAFGAIVGGMKKVTKFENGKYTYSDEVIQDSFDGKTVKLIADINLGDAEANNDETKIFYPIGYWNNEGTYERLPAGERVNAVSSGFYTFEGVFDGNGNTIKNFYQNTWEMKGDHDWYDTTTEQYFRDGMGLFGKVYGGTVKNLIVDSFSCDSEIGTTGVIAAYADSKNGQPALFENITITNCNPRVYNIGNGGIVGCAGWYSRNESLGNADYTNAVTFRNITVDQTNKISALWGSWGVSCAGILGQYYPNSACGIKLENCHVAAIIDVNNDVCSNYQYYWYRYAGMFIGTIRANTYDANGYEIADTTGVTAKDCTYTMGNWNEYWYCEIVANTIASYTHDHQFSRLDNIYSLSEIQDGNGNWKKEGHFALLDENRDIVDCYHIFKNSYGNLYQHFHDEGDETNGNEPYETVDVDGDGVKETVLKEDRQRYFIPFNQLLTGLDMGIKAHTEFDGITFVADGTVKSAEKFESIAGDLTYKAGEALTLGELVKAIVDESKIAKATLYATVSPAIDNDNTQVSATYSLDASDWRNSSITFGENCTGAVKIVITDYFYCTPTVIILGAHECVYEEIEENRVAATCTEAGSYDRVVRCIDCKKVLSRETITIDAPGHNAGPDATCTEAQTCTVCGTELAPALNHSYTAVTTAPTCTEKGYTTYTCWCGDTYVADEVAAAGHNYNAVVTAPTCTEDGYTTYTCTKCVDTYVADKVAATGHDYNKVVTAPTCTDDGYTTYTCKKCPHTYTADEVKALGHAFEFESKFNGDFLYRVGNQNEFSIDALFTVNNYNNIKVTIPGETSGVSVKYDTTSHKINFTGTGVVKVKFTDTICDKFTELELEVIDAVNATGATSATSNNVVLLNDCGFSSLEVSGGYTLYGNGFTMTCGSDSAALDMGYSFVTLNNGTLDNVQIVCPNFDYAVLYKSNMTESGNRSETTDRTRYYNVKSGVMVSGNSQILNSRISGARAAVNVTGGNCVIDNSRIEGGAVASLLIGAANSVTLRDVTLVQKPTASTHDPSKVLMGFSVLFICDSNGNAAPVKLEGTLVQNAWVNEDYKKYVPSAGQDIVAGVMKETSFIHNVNGKDSLNLGFAYLPEDTSSSLSKPQNITDNRTDKATIPYEMKDVKIQIAILSTTVYVYSYKNTNGTADSFKTESEYVPNKYGDIITVTYSDTKDGLESGKSFGTDGWVYELNVDLDKASGYKLDFSKLSMTVNGTTVTDYKVNGSAKPTSPVAVTAGGTTYTLTATIDGKTYTATFKVTGTETSKESPSKISGPTTAGFGVAKSYGGDWSGAADVLTGVKVKYWSVAENKYVEFDFSNFTVPGNAGKLNGTNSYWEYTHANNDFTLKVTNTVAIHSGKSVYGMPIRGTDGKLYFTISSTNGYVGSGTTSRAVTMQYEFTDNNGGEKLTFTHTFNISYNKDDQYSYSDLSGSGKLTKLESSSGGSSSGCVTPDTLITLADGSQVRVDALTGYEELLVWNLETGKLDKAPIMFIDMEEAVEQKVITLVFSDGTEVKVIYEHGFWDYDLNKYVYLDENAADYIGHTFAKQNGDSLEKVQLVNVVIETEVSEAWSPVTVGHLCYFVNGMLSMPGGVGGLFNFFDVDPETMTYDFEAMQRDIETYGLFTYEEMYEICPLTEEMFEAAGGAYLKVSMGKGNLTEEELIYMISRYSIFLNLLNL